MPWRHKEFSLQSQKGMDNIGQHLALLLIQICVHLQSVTDVVWPAGLVEEDDDVNVVEETFRQAYRNSQAEAICVPGLQEFAGSVSEGMCVTQTLTGS